MSTRDLHIQRLRAALNEIPGFLRKSPDAGGADFKQWRQSVHQSLNALWSPSTYAMRFGNIHFHGYTPPGYGRVRAHCEPPREAWKRGFAEAGVVIREAIEEACAEETNTSAPRAQLGVESDSTMTNVFVSRPTWLAPEFKAGHDGFIELLGTLGLRPRTLGTTDYPSRAPLDEVIELVNQCQGAIILGYPQITVSAGTVKDKVIEQPFLLPTEWNHIEAGLAHARALPLLAIHHIGVKRGIFDRGAMNSFLYERDLTEPSWPLETALLRAIKKWKEECLQSRS